MTTPWAHKNITGYTISLHWDQNMRFSFQNPIESVKCVFQVFLVANLVVYVEIGL